MTRPSEIPGRLKGGLLRFLRAVRGDLTPASVVWALLGGLTGSAIGWLFVALWNR